MAGSSRSYVSHACNELNRSGWLRFVNTPNSRIAVPAFPREVEDERIEKLLWEKDMAPYLGEFLMRKLLDNTVASTTFMDNARPSFLRNPKTNQPLEYDRLYFEGVAFEFNGEQHYSTTSEFPDPQALQERRTRDLIKVALSLENGITLVTVVDEDLSVEGRRFLYPIATLVCHKYTFLLIITSVSTSSRTTCT